MLKKKLFPPKNTLPVKGRFPPISSSSGWVAEGLLAALFAGMALFILLYTWVSANSILVSYSLLRNLAIAVVVILWMILVYWLVGRFRRKRFSAGKPDPLMMRQLMGSCLAEDCGEINELLSTSGISDVEIFKRFMTAKLQEILDREGLRRQDFQTRFRESRIPPIKGTRLNQFFYAPSEFDQLSLPSDLEAVYKALAPFYPQIEMPLDHLKNSRQRLFTIFCDYPALWHITDKEIEKLQQTYRYNPPEYEVAKKLAFADKIIRFFKKERQGGLSPSQHHFLDQSARQKVSQLKSALVDYQRAWKGLVKSYETLALEGLGKK